MIDRIKELVRNYKASQERNCGCTSQRMCDDCQDAFYGK